MSRERSKTEEERFKRIYEPIIGKLNGAPREWVKLFAFQEGYPDLRGYWKHIRSRDWDFYDIWNEVHPLIESRNRVEDKPIPDRLTIEEYPLIKPHVYAKIVQDLSRGSLTYIQVEPELNDEEKLQLDRLKEIMIEVVDVHLKEIETKEAATAYLRNKSIEILNNYGFQADKSTQEKLLYYLVRDHLGFGKIDPLMHDPLIEDISCDGVNIHLYVWHRKYEYVPTNIYFQNAKELNSYALRLAYMCGRHISIAQPILDASLPDGSRIHLTYGTEITRRGSTFTIRRFKEDPLTIIDIINLETLTSEIAAFFWYAVENRVSIIVAGGIASGKTTLLNCLSMFIKPDFKIVSIEDTPELNLPHENWIPTTTRTHFGLETETADITLFDLLKAALRQRPDYIIVGEVRGDEAYTLFQAISTGHLGMSTIHAESIETVVYRLESEPMNIPRTLISGIDLLTVQRRFIHGDKPTRKTLVTSEIVGLDPRSRELLTNKVYEWNSAENTFDFSGRSYIVERIAERRGISIAEAYEDVQRRRKILDWMCKQNIRNYRQVSEVVRKYYENPEKTYLEAIKGE
ncbi:MAG: type II/IV secretion system ATPase subunit [Candidatus Bathyarchaeota archaeon]|nr:MAG: type II/IV secretion system ATPase subunit [Candidatus Bathyarchaeota archaeon]